MKTFIFWLGIFYGSTGLFYLFTEHWAKGALGITLGLLSVVAQNYIDGQVKRKK